MASVPCRTSVRAPGGGLADVERPRPHDAAGADRLGEAVEVDRLVGGDEAHLQLAGAPALAHDEVAQQADLRAAVVGGQAALAAPPQRRAPRLVAGLGGQQAVLDVLDALPRARRVEAAHQRAVVAGAERVLELVAVAPLLDRRHERLELVAVEPADPPQGVVDLLGLDRDLALVGQHLPRRARMQRDRLDAVRARFEQRDGARLGVGLLALGHHGAHAVAGHRVAHEDDVALVARHAGAAEREALDRQLELLAALDARLDGGVHCPQRSSGELLLDRAQHGLARVVARLVVAHLAQLRGREVLEAALDLRRGQLVVERDRERGADADAPARAVDLAQHAVAGLQRLRAAAAEQLLEVRAEAVGLRAPRRRAGSG